MKIIKLFSPIFLLVMMAAINTTLAQTEVSIKAGANFSNVVLEDEAGDRKDTRFSPGYHVGVSVDVPVGGDFYIQPGALYSRKGFKQEDSAFAGSGNPFRVTVSYIELPLNFLYKPRLGSGRLLLGAGPYLGYGTGGSWEADDSIVIGDIIHEDHGDVIFENDIRDGEWGTYLYGKPLDYGANFIAGYEFFDKFSAHFNVQLGLANLQPEVDGTEPEGTFRNVGFGLSLGYKL